MSDPFGGPGSGFGFPGVLPSYTPPHGLFQSGGEWAPGQLFLFPAPQVVRIRYPLESAPVFSLWTRVKRDLPSTVIRNSQGVWEEWPGAWPWTKNPRNKFLFGSQGFNTMGSDQSQWSAPQRLYLGGHNYVISLPLMQELLAAFTTYAPDGYAAYIVQAPPGAVYTGDEIILSGYSSDTGKPANV